MRDGGLLLTARAAQAGWLGCAAQAKQGSTARDGSGMRGRRGRGVRQDAQAHGYRKWQGRCLKGSGVIENGGGGGAFYGAFGQLKGPT